MDSLSYLTISPSSHHNTTCIFLHGLGDSGHGWYTIMRKISKKFPFTKFILPHAPKKRVTLNSGALIPAWYDIVKLNEDSEQDQTGIIASAKDILTLVSAEVKGGITQDRIVIGGFSQGGAIALTAGLLYKNISNASTNKKDFAGILALSTYLPIESHFHELKTYVASNTPIYMTHGTSDKVISFEWANNSYHTLRDEFKCKTIKFEPVPEMGHSFNWEGMKSIEMFLKKVF